MSKRILDKLQRSIPLSAQEIAYVQDLFSCGLKWEKKKEPCEESLDRMMPFLEEVSENSIIRDTQQYPTHLLVEGENLYSLMVLAQSHREKVDMIYIDPPYNRGINDFVYQDNYIDGQDAYRHSGWLSFMDKEPAGNVNSRRVALGLRSGLSLLLCF